MKMTRTLLTLLLLPLVGTVSDSAILCVKTTGVDTNAGTSWAAPKKTISAALTASAPGGQVWVAAGTYTQNITLKVGVALYGGFAGTETNLTDRNPAINVSVIDGNKVDSAVIVPEGCAASTVIDGFTIQNGAATYGGGIYCQNTSPLISGNTVKSNKAAYYGGGIYVEGGSPVIACNTIKTNTAPIGAGVAYFPYLAGASGGKLINNLIAGNTSEFEGSAAAFEYASNVSAPNNTIADNTATGSGPAVYCEGSSPSITANVIAFNSSGIAAKQGLPLLNSNIIHSNGATNYSGLAAGANDAQIDPKFVNRSAGDYHLASNSPAIDFAGQTLYSPYVFDIDHQGRYFGRAIDAGADEFWSATPSIWDFKRAADTAMVTGSGYVVTAAFTDHFYIEAEDRSSGVRVDKGAHGIQAGSRVTVTGVLSTSADTGERTILASSIVQGGTGSVAPLHVRNRNLGGTSLMYDPVTGAGQIGVYNGYGLNNLGILVRLNGKFLFVDATTFTVNDGTGAVRCTVPAGVTLNPAWTFVDAVGISAAYKSGNSFGRMLKIADVAGVNAF